jgi:hypothetical protein
VLRSREREREVRGFTCINSHTKGCVRGGGLFFEPRGCHSFLASAFFFLLQLLELLLPLKLLKVPMPSSKPFSWGLKPQEQGQGIHTAELGAHLIKTLQIQFGEGPKNFNLFVSWQTR